MKWLRHYFWAPIRSGENSAQTLVRVFGNFARWLLLLPLIVIAFVLVALAFSVVEERRQAHRISKIEATVRFGQDGCPENYPVFVGFVNRHDYPVADIHASLSARRSDRTTNLISEWRQRQLATDYIIDPDQGVGRCYSFALDGDVAAESLIWSVRVTSASRWDPG